MAETQASLDTGGHAPQSPRRLDECRAQPPLPFSRITRTTTAQDCFTPKTPTRVSNYTPHHTPCSLKNSANVGRRRAHPDSVVLRSPARPGHMNRMQEIFRKAGVAAISSNHGDHVVYPQLPNVSACLSPVVSNIGTRVYSTPLSRETSDSWSDDSGYIWVRHEARGDFNLSTHNRPFDDASPTPDILQWLSDVASANENQPRLPPAPASPELEPLSPNVCLKRGSSRLISTQSSSVGTRDCKRS